ncbi:hypothetical protein DUNSADRAFT_17778 [Dunaliella salina]|uniref:BHLH domain-containing protein n=1 Tax=Dunaliella salina TaxID=3046 RepID=A0ABQ7G155_DUNSA|nr:hypothetical protein DUNSADRAFT_17778 [Dunaliella salina]|eukprot:KAF5828322.1 hypothetical protein DUNSADRAFT_17778 [Dunaliella salina]
MTEPPPPSDVSANLPWPSGLGASYLDFLSDDACPSLFMDLLDPQTLQAVCNQNVDVLGPPPVPPSEDTRRKLQEQDSDAGSDAEEQGSGSKGGGGGGTGGSVGNKKAARSEANQAAKNKATREKARREKINDRFSELAQLIDPGKDPKTDKPSILQDAIKCVQQMRMENHQLRQLNKFLEERMGQLERERGQNLYQQSLMMQQGGGGMMGMPGPSSMPPFHASQPSTSANTSAQVAAAAAAMAAASGGPHPTGASTTSGPFPSMRLPPQAAASTSGRPPASHGSNLPGGAFAAAAAAAAAAIQAGAGEKRAGTPLGGTSKAARASPKLPPMQSCGVGGGSGGGAGVGAQGGSSIHVDVQGCGGVLGDAAAQPHHVAGTPGLPSPPQQGEVGIPPDLDDPGLPGSLQMPAVSFPPPAGKLGQPGLPMGPGAPWFPGVGEAGVGTSMGMGLGGDPLFGGNWVKPEMLDSMQDSLLRPPAA